MGRFKVESMEETALANAEALAQVRLLEDIVGMDYEKFLELVSNE